MSPGCLSCSGLGNTTDFYRLFFVLQQHNILTDFFFFLAYIQVITVGTAKQSHVYSSTMWTFSF